MASPFRTRMAASLHRSTLLPHPPPPTPSCVSTSPLRQSIRAQQSRSKHSIHVFRTVAELSTHRAALRASSLTVGLVPTMGALHAGHLSLVRAAAAENASVIVTIYVNPTQFGLTEDLASYPATWDADMALLGALDVELAASKSGRITAVFAPTTRDMYPTLPPSSALDGHGSFVTITPLASVLEGASRPVFFRGVATVCMKLFNIVSPERVYFGQKDVQQTVVIRRMVADFHLDLTLRIVPTEREPDGLALSSRNVYLGARRRAVGVALSRALRAAAGAFERGSRDRGKVLGPAMAVLEAEAEEQRGKALGQGALFEVDYVSLADPETLAELEAVDERMGAILSGAIKMLPLDELQPGEDGGLGDGKIPVRLIDNIILPPTATRDCSK